MKTQQVLKRFLSTTTFVRDIIKNPVCLDCSHYIEYKQSNPYDELYGSYKLGRCGLFGRQNVVTGQIHLADALECRENESKCGEKGKHFDLKWKKKQT
jgi:hypothetical protein